MDPAELRRLAAEVSAQHGIRVDPDDPIMAVVTLNRLILERTLTTATDLIHTATREFNHAAERVQIRAGSVVAEEVRESASIVRAEIQKDIDNARLKACKLIGELGARQSGSRNWPWLAAGLLTGGGLFLAGFLAGTLVR